ncbi:hypothetical protein [uncultured Faecalibaculum sp.]|uniref:hypothetical protein n=1 Tax=uncultured Faecalibaculum sp. TaxID=1729681 RepID=UPI002617CFC1|nr:hypothetical protein [uncultured Faecalibaculum sp.]
MKKLSKLITALLLCLFLTACSQAGENEKKQAALTFFDALHKTMTAESMEVEGSADIKAGTSISGDFHLYLNQKDDLQLAFLVNGSAMGIPVGDLFNFYIRDGRTYLNAMGTKSQSLAENIGLKPGEKLESWDPFLSLTDEEKVNCFKSVSVKGDAYHFVIDAADLAYTLDSMGSTTLSRADMDATIQDGILQGLKLDLEGEYRISDQSQPFTAAITMQARDVDGNVTVPYPADLDSWGK